MALHLGGCDGDLAITSTDNHLCQDGFPVRVGAAPTGRAEFSGPR